MEDKLFIKMIPPVIIATFISLIGYASTSYVDNAIIRVRNEMIVNKTRIELIYDSLSRIEKNIESVRNHVENK